MITFSRSRHPGSYGVVSSGSVSLPSDAATVSLPLEDLRVTFEFSQGPGGSQNVQVLGHDDKSVRIGLVNFDNPLGVAWESPIGQHQGIELFISILVNTVSSSDDSRKPRILSYTFFKRVA